MLLGWLYWISLSTLWQACDFDGRQKLSKRKARHASQPKTARTTGSKEAKSDVNDVRNANAAQSQPVLEGHSEQPKVANTYSFRRINLGLARRCNAAKKESETESIWLCVKSNAGWRNSREKVNRPPTHPQIESLGFKDPVNQT